MTSRFPCLGASPVSFPPYIQIITIYGGKETRASHESWLHVPLPVFRSWPDLVPARYAPGSRAGYIYPERF